MSLFKDHKLQGPDLDQRFHPFLDGNPTVPARSGEKEPLVANANDLCMSISFSG